MRLRHPTSAPRGLVVPAHVGAWNEPCSEAAWSHGACSLRTDSVIVMGTAAEVFMAKNPTNDEIDAAIAKRLDEVDFAAEFRAEGITTVALDEDGRIVEHRPDGTSSIVGSIK